MSPRKSNLSPSHGWGAAAADATHPPSIFEVFESKKSVWGSRIPFLSLSLSLSRAASMNGRGGVKLANIIEQQERE